MCSSILIRIILGLLPIASLWIIKALINSATLLLQGKGTYYSAVLILLFLQLLVSIVNSFLINFKEIIDEHANVKFDFILGEMVSKRAANVPLAYFDLPEFFNHLERINGNLGNKILSPIRNIFDTLQSIITLFSYFSFLLFVHWILVVLCLLTAVPILIVQYKYGSAKFFLMRFQTPLARKANYTKALINDRHTAKEIRLFGLSTFLLDRWRELYFKNSREMLKLIKREKFSRIGLDLTTSLLYIGAAFISITLLKSKQLGVGGFVSITQAIQGAQSSINMVASNIAKILQEQLYIEDFFRFMEFELSDVKITKNISVKPFPKELKVGISFENVSFHYPRGKNILNSVTFTIYPGEKIAIVGENGSGKTTLIKCLMGLYQVTTGNIRFDSIDIDDIAFDDLRRHITVIFQDFIRYSYTVYDNIAFGDLRHYKNYDLIKKVSESSGVDNFVSKFKNGYATELGRYLTDGEDLSGGQWQKMALARTLLRSGEIVILDEPTSALDPQTELEVFEQFDTMTKDKTVIFISHRMAAARLADRILVMKNGHLVEVGNHNELMAYNSEYKKMFVMQAKWYA